MVSLKFLLLSFILPTLVCQSVVGNEMYYAQSELLDSLLLDYDKTYRPSPTVDTPVNVTLGIAVAQIIRVDEKSEGMYLNVWYRMKWKDYRLAWDPKQYKNNTGPLKIDSDYLWTPDIMLYKPLTSDAAHVLGTTKDEADLSWKLGILSDGTVTFNFPGVIHGQCALNIADYPFDEHSCSFVFASWVHDSSEIILTPREADPLDFSSYVLNNEWHITGSATENADEKYDCCPDVFKKVVFYISVRRGASSYVSNYIIPSILIVILSLMMFTLPPEVGKRMEIGINLLLCLSVYLTIVNTKMPTRSDVFPLLSKFYGFCIFILTCSLLCTCWVVAYYFHDMSGWKIYKMPNVVQIGVLHYLGRALRLTHVKKVSPDKVDSVGSQKKIEVKPVSNQQTNFMGRKPKANANTENEIVKKEENIRDVEKKAAKDESELSVKTKPQNEKGDHVAVNETQSKKKDEKKEIARSERKTVEKASNEKIKDKRASRKESKELSDVKVEKIKPANPESVQMKAMGKTPKETKDKTQTQSTEDTKRRTSNDKTVSSDADSGVIADSEKTSRRDSKESKHSESSKKSNRALSTSLSPGLIEQTKKTRRHKKAVKEIGVVNEGTDNMEEAQKETGNKSETKEPDGKSEEHPPVREAPWLENKTEITGAPLKDEKNGEVNVFDGKTTSDFDFTAKAPKLKKHASIKWLSELAEYYADRTQRKKNRYQWRQAATILNRLFGIMLLVSIIMAIVILFLAR